MLSWPTILTPIAMSGRSIAKAELSHLSRTHFSFRASFPAACFKSENWQDCILAGWT